MDVDAKQLESLGFHRRLVQKALGEVNKDPAFAKAEVEVKVQAALDFLLANPASPDAMKGFLVEDIMELGFSKSDAEIAIASTSSAKDHFDFEKAVSWLSERDLNKEKKLSVKLARSKSEEEIKAAESKLKVVEEKKDFEVKSPRSASPSAAKADPLTTKLSFSGKIKLVSTSDDLYLGISVDSGSVFLTSSEEEAATLSIVHPIRALDQSELSSPVSVALELDGENKFLAGEVDGSVNCRRSGPVGLFGSWKLTVIESKSDDLKDTGFYHGYIVRLESALKTLLFATAKTKAVSAVEPDASLKPKPGSFTGADWKIEVVSPCAPKRVVEKKSAKELWRILRTNFVLAALRLRNEQVKDFKEQVDKLKKTLNASVDADLTMCIICWENPRNTVILECGHICVCTDCTDAASEECPICRKPVTRIINIRE